jgi:hypothetical protein
MKSENARAERGAGGNGGYRLPTIQLRSWLGLAAPESEVSILLSSCWPVLSELARARGGVGSHLSKGSALNQQKSFPCAHLAVVSSANSKAIVLMKSWD